MTSVQIGGGADATVELDSESMMVSKRYRTSDSKLAAELTLREFGYLRRFSSVLQNQPYIQCPTPVDHIPEEGVITMTFCAGSRLDHLLADPHTHIQEHLKHIAIQIAIGLELYVEEFDEPYYDLGVYNMIYHPESCQLSFIDFIIPSIFTAPMNSDDIVKYRFELSLGAYIGFAIYYSVRPSTWKNKQYWSLNEFLAAAILTELSQRHDLCLLHVRRVSNLAYSFAGPRGRPLRRLWYSTVGAILYRRRFDAIVERFESNGSEASSTHGEMITRS